MPTYIHILLWLTRKMEQEELDPSLTFLLDVLEASLSYLLLLFLYFTMVLSLLPASPPNNHTCKYLRSEQIPMHILSGV